MVPARVITLRRVSDLENATQAELEAALARRQELDAALAARRDLGADYEPALVESFLSKMENQIDARVDARVAARTRTLRAVDQSAGWRQAILGFVSLGTGIPITAIAATQADLAGVVVSWAGIVGVNVAHALSVRRQQHD